MGDSVAVFVGRRLDVQIKKAIKKRDFHKNEVRKQSALLKVLLDKRQAALKKKIRKIATKKAKSVGGAISRVRCRGHPQRWPGHCLSCLMRYLKEPGGPKHDRTLCEKTQKVIKSRPQWVTKTFRKR